MENNELENKKKEYETKYNASIPSAEFLEYIDFNVFYSIKFLWNDWQTRHPHEYLPKVIYQALEKNTHDSIKGYYEYQVRSGQEPPKWEFHEPIVEVEYWINQFSREIMNSKKITMWLNDKSLLKDMRELNEYTRIRKKRTDSTTYGLYEYIYDFDTDGYYLDYDVYEVYLVLNELLNPSWRIIRKKNHPGYDPDKFKVDVVDWPHVLF